MKAIALLILTLISIGASSEEVLTYDWYGKSRSPLHSARTLGHSAHIDAMAGRFDLAAAKMDRVYGYLSTVNSYPPSAFSDPEYDNIRRRSISKCIDAEQKANELSDPQFYRLVGVYGVRSDFLDLRWSMKRCAVLRRQLNRMQPGLE